MIHSSAPHGIILIEREIDYGGLQVAGLTDIIGDGARVNY